MNSLISSPWSLMCYEHSWSTQHGSLITTGALCHVFWVNWEHSCPSKGMEHLFRPCPGAPWHAGSTLPCIFSTLATLFRAMVGQFCREHSPMHSESRWEHSSLRWLWNYVESTLPCILSLPGSTVPCDGSEITPGALFHAFWVPHGNPIFSGMHGALYRPFLLALNHGGWASREN